MDHPSGMGVVHNPEHGLGKGDYVRHPKKGVGKIHSTGIFHGKPSHRIQWAGGGDSMHSNQQVGKMGKSSKSGWDAWKAKKGGK